MSIVRPRRSALYVPGSNRRAIKKAAALDADVFLFDLEDSIAPEEKLLARDQACQAVLARNQGSGQFGNRELVLRINGPATPWYTDDLQQCAKAGPDAILLPKVEDPAHIVAAVRELESLGASDQTRLWCMLETPRGVLGASSIAGAHERLTCLVMGTSDLTNDLRAQLTPDRLPLLASLGLCILAARAHGKVILDGVSLDLSNENAFRASCRQGRELGFDGKTLVHPRQISDCNAAFSPTEAEIAKASAIIAAYCVARADGRGVALLEGRLIEELHVREAERMLAMSAAISARSPGLNHSREATTAD